MLRSRSNREMEDLIEGKDIVCFEVANVEIVEPMSLRMKDGKILKEYWKLELLNKDER